MLFTSLIQWQTRVIWREVKILHHYNILVFSRLIDLECTFTLQNIGNFSKAWLRTIFQYPYKLF